MTNSDIQSYVPMIGDAFRDDVSNHDLIIITKIDGKLVYSTFYNSFLDKTSGAHTIEDFKHKILPLYHLVYGKDKIPCSKL